VLIVKDIAQLIVERATLINHLLPQDEQRTELAEHVLTAMIDMFYMYLIKAQLPQIEAAFQWVCTQPVLCYTAILPPPNKEVMFLVWSVCLSVCLSVYLFVCCITSSREWALLSFQDVCVSVCLSVIPRPTAYHD